MYGVKQEEEQRRANLAYLRFVKEDERDDWSGKGLRRYLKKLRNYSRAQKRATGRNSR